MFENSIGNVKGVTALASLWAWNGPEMRQRIVFCTILPKTILGLPLCKNGVFGLCRYTPWKHAVIPVIFAQSKYTDRVLSPATNRTC